jgi:GT2 family glycosyltransferase
MMQFDLLIPSHGGINPISHLLQSLHDQTILPTRLVILVRQEKTVSELQEFIKQVHHVLDGFDIDIVVLHSSYTDHNHWHWVGYDRHFLITQAQSEYLCMIDEDNVLPPRQLDIWIQLYTQVVKTILKEAIVSPTIMRRGKIQSQWIIWFTYFFPKYQFWHLKDKPWHEVKMLWANSLFGRTAIFQQVQFDPLFAGSYEDIDFSSRVVKTWYAVVVLRDCWIDHQEWRKTRLQELFLWNPTTARIRSCNRILRVSKTATLRQKIQYFGVWVWVQTWWRILFVIKHGWKQKRPIIWSIFRWIRDGICKKL